MEIKSLQYKYATGRLTLPFVYFIFSFIWVITAIMTPNTPPILSLHSPLWNILPVELTPWWLNQSLAYLLFMLVSYALILLNNRFTIITQRATIQSSLFLLTIAALPFIQVLSPGLFATLLFTVHTFILFNCYRDENSMSFQFYGGVFFSLIFLLIPKAIFLLPLILFTKIVFNNLTIRTILASLLGFCLPLWFLLGHAVWHEQVDLFLSPFVNLTEWSFIWSMYPSLSLSTLAAYVFILICTGLSITYTTFARAKVRVRTRQILNHFLRIALGIAVLITLEPTLFKELATIWIVCISFTYGHALVSIQTKLTNLIFISAMLLLITLFVFNVWML